MRSAPAFSPCKPDRRQKRDAKYVFPCALPYRTDLDKNRYSSSLQEAMMRERRLQGYSLDTIPESHISQWPLPIAPSLCGRKTAGDAAPATCKIPSAPRSMRNML